MAVTSKGVFIIGAKRTPFIKYGGVFKELPASQIFATAAKIAMQSANIKPHLIDATIVGNVHFLSQCDGGKTPRHCGLYSGVPVDKPALAVNKACGSGIQAVITSAIDISTGSSKIILTGGTEIMSTLPLLARNVRFGSPLGSVNHLHEYISSQTFDNTGMTLKDIANHLQEKHGISEEDVENYSLNARNKWEVAKNKGTFKEEIAPVTISNSKARSCIVSEDEVLENKKELRNIADNEYLSSFGNSTYPSDGAAAIILADEVTLSSQNIQPLARVVGWSCVGVEQEQTGLAMKVAVDKLLGTVGMRVQDVDLFELNDAFAVEAILSSRLLGVDPENINTESSTLALGHPVAATGARMVTHLACKLRRQNSKIGVATSNCGGQGVAVMIENVS